MFISKTIKKRVSVKHPLIDDAYLKDTSSHARGKNVLILELVKKYKQAKKGKSFKSSLADLLTDLPSIKSQAEATGLHIDRIDLVRH